MCNWGKPKLQLLHWFGQIAYQIPLIWCLEPKFSFLTDLTYITPSLETRIDLRKGKKIAYFSLFGQICRKKLVKICHVFWATIILTWVGFRALTLPLRWQCNPKISSQSKFQPNWTSGCRDMAILFKMEAKK